MISKKLLIALFIAILSINTLLFMIVAIFNIWMLFSGSWLEFSTVLFENDLSLSADMDKQTIILPMLILLALLFINFVAIKNMLLNKQYFATGAVWANMIGCLYFLLFEDYLSIGAYSLTQVYLIKAYTAVYNRPQYKKYLVCQFSHSSITSCILISVLAAFLTVGLSWYLGQKTINSCDRANGYKVDGTLFMVPLLNIAVGNNIEVTQNINDDKASITFFYIIYSSEIQDKIFKHAHTEDASPVEGKLKIRSANVLVGGENAQIKQLTCSFNNGIFIFNYGPTGYRFKNSLILDNTLDVPNEKHKLAVEEMTQDIVFQLSRRK